MIWPKAYRHATADSVAMLLRCEENVFDRTQRESIFYKFGRLLLREDYFSSSLDATFRARSSAVIRLMTGRPPIYWQTTRTFARRMPIRSAATAILLKNNIRAIYPQFGLTLKVSNPQDAASTGRILNEATKRKSIHTAGGFTVPDIISSNDHAESPFILETLLENHRPFTASDMDADFVSGFVKFQLANRTDSLALTKDLSPGTAISQFESLMRVANLDIPPRLFQFLQAAAAKAAIAQPVSLCHGDLSRSNILVSGKVFTVIDWEFSQVAPSAIDAVRLATQFPGFARAYIKELGHPDARAWVVLGCVYAANAHAERLQGLAVNRHQHLAWRKTARKLAEITALADRLAMQEI